MSLLVTFNGANYIIPTTNEVGWGSNLDAYFVAIAAGCLQKTGGNFVLSAETDFGASFGLKSLYYKSRGSNIASTGVLRLNNNSDSINWRNAANNADLSLLVNASNQLTFNGSPIPSSPSSFVASITGTANQVIASSSTGAVTLSLPQDIATTSTPTFDSIVLNDVGSPKVTLKPASGTVTSSEVRILDSASFGLTIKHFGSGIVGTINGRSATSNSQLTDSNTLFIDVPTGNVISLGVNNTEVGYFDNTGLHLPTALEVASGGTGHTSLTAYSILAAGTTSTGALQQIGVGLSGQVLTSNGPGALPSMQNVAGTGTVDSGTAGRLALYNTSTNEVGDTYTQNAQPIRVAITAQPTRSTGLTMSYPNPGDAVASANILLSQGAQTINGIQTFTAVTNLFTAARTDTQGDCPILLSDGEKYGFRMDTSNALNLDSFNGAVWSTPLVLSNTGDFTIPGRLTTTKASGAAILAQTSNSGGSVGLFADNQSNTASSDAQLSMRVAGTSAGNPYISFNILSSTQWAIGTDNVDSDKWKISQASTIGTNDYLIINPTTTAVSIKGTNTNDTATSGFVGETALANQTTFTAFPTSGNFGDLTSLSLTAGDWLVWGIYEFLGNGGTTSEFQIAITTTSGNSTSGFTNGLNNFQYRGPTSFTGTNDTPISTGAIRFSLSGTTTIYLKYEATYTSTAPSASGNIRALRIR